MALNIVFSEHGEMDTEVNILISHTFPVNTREKKTIKTNIPRRQTHPNLDNFSVKQEGRGDQGSQHPHRDNEISGTFNGLVTVHNAGRETLSNFFKI